MTICFPATANLDISTGLLFGMGGTEFLFHFAVITVSAILLWLGVNWVEHLRVQWFLNARTPKTLFRELCRAHGLSHADRRCLSQIAQPSSSDQCCRVFIDPRVIDDFARAHPAAANECRRLARQLFGESAR
jgi:hypothetical protein